MATRTKLRPRVEFRNRPILTCSKDTYSDGLAIEFEGRFSLAPMKWRLASMHFPVALEE